MAAHKPARLAWVLLAALILPGLAACGQDAPAASKSKATAVSTAKAAAVSFERETKTFAFTYAYPPEAAALPGLARMLDAERAQSLAELEAEAAEAQEDASADDYPYNPHMRGVSWTVTGQTQQLLAMVGEISSYSGGAHGNTGYEALIWDKAGDRRVQLEDLFTDLTAALAPMREPFCNALNAERREKRGEFVGEDDDMFNTCPPVAELVLVPYAGGSGGFDRMMFIAAPYVAGPYVEGVYEISLPLPGVTLDQVKKDYRAAFMAEG